MFTVLPLLSKGLRPCATTMLLLGLAVSCHAQASQDETTSSDASVQAAAPHAWSRVHGQRINPNAQADNPDVQHDKGFGSPACTPAVLQYNSGAVIANVVVVPVFWNAYVNPTIQAKMPLFLSDIVRTDYLQQLSEYATDTPSVTDRTMTKQSIGLGSSTRGVVFKPLKCATAAACTLQDADIQNELSRQIGLHTIPAPTLGYDGKVQTLYVMYFPPNVNVNSGDGSAMCGTWCGIHEDATYPLSGGKPFTFAMIGDSITGACNSGCGSSNDPVQNMASTTWHELAEAITDPLSAVTAWYDNSPNCNNAGGEIGDLCDNGTNYPVTVNGRTWHVQSLWSNKLKSCTLGGVLPALKVTAPPTVTASDPFRVKMTVVNPSAGRSNDRAFAGTVRFASSDIDATLPRPYSFKPGSTGAVTTTAVLNSEGTQSILAHDSDTAINGKVSVNVDPGLNVGVATLPAGLAFTVDGVTYNSAQTFTWKIGETHTLSTAATQQRAAGEKQAFTVWSDGGPQTHTITVDTAHTSFTAAFATSYLLTTSSVPAGIGAVSPAAGQYYAAGTVVSLAAVTRNSAQSTFSGWSGDLTGAYPAATITMDAPHTVTARFLPQGTASPVLRVVSSTSHAAEGQSVTLSVTASGKAGVPRGYVEFYQGGVHLGGADLVNGTARFTTTALAPGSQPIVVMYNGDGIYRSGATAVDQEVVAAGR